MTTLWKNPSTGNLLKLPGGDLMGDDAGCCCVNCETDGPTASFTVTDNGDCDVDLTDTSTAGLGAITGWDWDFGDGSTSTLQNPSHTFSIGGCHDIELTVTDENGCTDTTTMEVCCCKNCPDSQPDTVSVTASGFFPGGLGGSNCDVQANYNATNVLTRYDTGISICGYEICWDGNRVTGGAACYARIIAVVYASRFQVDFSQGNDTCAAPGFSGTVASYIKTRAITDACAGTHTLTRVAGTGPASITLEV